MNHQPKYIARRYVRAFVLQCTTDMIIDHNTPQYIKRRAGLSGGFHNGAYYYSKEIVENIIPEIRTDRNWITVNVPGLARDHSIVFIHNNVRPSTYHWLKKYKDLVLICGIPETVPKVRYLGKAIYLPLSIDIGYVEQFRRPKTKEAAFVGRAAKKKYGTLPAGIDFIEGLPRDELLRTMAEYKTVYAVGRCALEAKALGCQLKPYDDRFPDVDRWKLLDNKEAAKLLQTELDLIDG